MPRKSSSANAPKRSDSNVRRVIGANIKARRLALDWNQQDLADRFGVSRSAISQYEIGTGEVNAGDLPRLGEILGLTLADFYRPPTRLNSGRAEEEPPSMPGDRPNATLEVWAGTGQESSRDAGQNGVGKSGGVGDTQERSRIVVWPGLKRNPDKGAAETLKDSPDEDAAELLAIFQSFPPAERRRALRVVRVLGGS